jgi:lipopolysaccharide transport system ATP-binding protein
MPSAISIHDVSKRYQLSRGGSRYRTLRDLFTRASSANTTGDFWALQHISCEIQAGEVVGLIGGNGAGKSTLLKILARVTAPTSGRVTMTGPVGSLLELGAGFHPELNGRDNIYLAGAILGMSRSEIRVQFDEIVAFADIGPHLNEPLKRYSSGMYLRLAFAVAAHLRCPTLLIDEVLAVGDARFQQRCLQSMDNAAREGRTVVFVSHDLGAVSRLCKRVLWLRDGKIAGDGATETVISQYVADAAGSDSLQAAVARARERCQDPTFAWESVHIEQDGQATVTLRNGASTDVRIRYRVLEPTRGLRVYIDILDDQGTLVFRSLHDEQDTEPGTMTTGTYCSTAHIPADVLVDRPLRIEIQATIFDVRYVAPAIAARIEVVRTTHVNGGYPQEPIRGRVLPPVRWNTVRENS